LVGLATDTTVYLSRQGEALKVNKPTFTIRASDSSWHPGLPGRPLFPSVKPDGETWRMRAVGTRNDPFIKEFACQNISP